MPFSQDFLAGAQVANMAWERQERMQMLRAQQAHQQIQEREIAARVQMLTEQSELYRQKRKMAESEDDDLAAANNLYHQMTETAGIDPEQARTQVDQALIFKNPELALKIQKIRTEEARQKKYLREKEVNPLATAKDQSVIDLNTARKAEIEAKTKQVVEGVKPLVADIDGQKVIYNPKTGRYETPDKGLTREKFINDHFNAMLSNEGDPNSAVEKLNAIYDKNFVKKEAQPIKHYNPATRKLE